LGFIAASEVVEAAGAEVLLVLAALVVGAGAVAAWLVGALRVGTEVWEEVVLAARSEVLAEPLRVGRLVWEVLVEAAEWLELLRVESKFFSLADIKRAATT
jgi:hypothetical protein